MISGEIPQQLGCSFGGVRVERDYLATRVAFNNCQFQMGRSGLLSVTVWSQGRRVPRPFTFLIFIYIPSGRRRGYKKEHPKTFSVDL
jgi:hypothetical protein